MKLDLISDNALALSSSTIPNHHKNDDDDDDDDDFETENHIHNIEG